MHWRKVRLPSKVREKSDSVKRVLTGLTTDMVITKDESFEPVAPLYRFKTDDEAIKMANDTEFGLAAYSTAATSAASGGSPKGWNTASRSFSRSNTSAWAASTASYCAAPRW